VYSGLVDLGGSNVNARRGEQHPIIMQTKGGSIGTLFGGEEVSKEEHGQGDLGAEDK